ncbi:MAG: lytic transglycosylase domain-containing protein [Muribaculaceae bacterium]|nr:lytic transglycosylase domain-containing protein [Muribaculaceae bacterium]
MKYINILLVTIVACATTFSINAQHDFMTVAAPDVPEAISFCGDHVSFDRIDMAERIDREMTTVIYGQTMTSLIIKRANRYFPRLIEILKENNMPEDLIYLAVAESSLDINALSPAKAAGIWQFMASTGKQYGLEVNDDVDERYDPEKETVAACKYLRNAYSKYGNWATVCASYNAGMGRISSELQTQQVNNSFDLRLVSETSRYVFRIIAYKLFLENPKKYGYRLYSNQLYQPIECDVIEVDKPVANWVTWAKEHGINYMQLRDANPWIRSTKLPNASGKVYKVKVPREDSLYRSKAGNKVYNRNWVVD